MSLIKPLTASLATVTLLTATIANASHAAPDHPTLPAGGALFERVDTDNDGSLSADELRAARGAVFDRLDRNADGMLTPTDAGRFISAACRDSILTRLRLRLDSDGDQRITRAEFVHTPMPALQWADQNRNAQLEPAELAGALERLRAPFSP